MGQAMGDAAAAQAGNSYDRLLENILTPFKQVKNNILAHGITKVALAPIHLVGTLLITVGSAMGGSKWALAKANKEKAKEVKEAEKAEKITASEPISEEKGDTAVVAAIAVPEKAEEAPKETEVATKEEDHSYYQEVFWFDDPADVEMMARGAASLNMDVKAGGNYLSCCKEDAEKISSLASCAGISCCSLTDLTTLFAYLSEARDEIAKSEQAEGLEAVLEPSDFESLRGQSPKKVVSFLQECGIKDAKLGKDGKIHVYEEDIENFKMAEENPLTAKAAREAANRITEMKMKDVVKSLGSHFKSKDVSEQSHDKSTTLDEQVDAAMKDLYDRIR